jgi:beta-phosphoglucomutase family hydrolase
MMKIPLSAIDAAIFDMDGVLVNNHQYHLNAWKEFCMRHGYKFDDKTFTTTYFGKNNREIISSLTGKDISADEAELLGEEKESIYREIYSPYIKPVDGLVDLLDYLKEKGVKLAVATSAPKANYKFIEKSLHLEKRFDKVIDASMVQHGKPDPEIYLKASELLKVRPSDCLVFEDSFSGIQAAKAAGMQVIALATTHTRNELGKNIIVADNFNEVMALIER